MSNQNKFIMLPTNDFCFKELMQNPKVRKGFIAGILGKDPSEIEKVSDESVLHWMKFFSGKTQEDFETMAKQDEYLEEAVNTLFELSADQKIKLEYEAREKALRDHSWMMHSAEQTGLERGLQKGLQQGLQQGREQGLQQGREQTKRIFQLYMSGKSAEEIAAECQIPLQDVNSVLN